MKHTIIDVLDVLTGSTSDSLYNIHPQLFTESEVNKKSKPDTDATPTSNKPLTTKIKTKTLSDGTEETLVIFFDGDVKIGEARVCDTADDPGNNFLYGVEVKSGFRGRGYGTKIVKYMIDKYHVKHLNVAKDNKIAQNLYKKFNFKFNGNVRMSNNEIMYRMTR